MRPSLSAITKSPVPMLTVLAIALSAALGCGSGNSLQPGTAATNRASGKAIFTITWPTPTRLTPAASNSITVTLAQGATFTTHQTVARPASGGASQVTFSGLPVGTLTATAVAYPNADGT